MKFSSGKIEVEIISQEEISGGVQLFARAWNDKKPIGFGKDGTVEIERFRIFKPPQYVDDKDGDIIRESTNKVTGEKTVRKLKFDPQKAIEETILHTIGIVGKDENKIVKGKIGNTTDTIYSSDNVSLERYVRGSNWTDIRDGTTATALVRNQNDNYVWVQYGSGTSDRSINRYFFTFDTSGIGTDSITSATLSAYYLAHGSTANSGNNVYEASNADTIIEADYNNTTTTAYATAKGHADITNNAYNDYALNATGIASINKTGTSHFAIREIYYDAGGTDPVVDINAYFNITLQYYTGTTRDPKLVVEHEVGSAIKSFNGLAKASIKNVNGLAIASVKSINGLA